jgi:Cu2+-exporting ATPase
VRAGGHAFCCPACRELWYALGEDGLAALRRGPGVGWQAAREASGPGPAPAEVGRPVRLALDGLWCPSCAVLVEHVVGRRPGVLRARVDFATGTLEALVDPRVTGAPALAEAVARLGYRARAQDAPDRALPDALRRLAVSAPLALAVMMGSVPVWSGQLPRLPAGVALALVATLWALATPVVFWGGAPFLRGAWASVRHGRPSMDALVAVGSLAAYGYSVASALTHGPHLYFDTAGMLVAFLLVGRALELGTRERAVGVMRLLGDLGAARAVRREGDREVEVPVEQLRPGDEVVVRPGQRIPADGVVLEGQSACDESALTGEPRPQDKGPGAPVYAGSLACDGRLVLRVTRVGEATVLGETVAAVRRAGAAGRLETQAERLVRGFVPGVLALAAVTLLATWRLGGLPLGAALWRAVAVLVIACPCALAVATPLAVLAAARRLGELGLLVRQGEALERAARVDTVVWDKTGTLTVGSPALLQAAPDDPGILALAAAVEAGSRHVLARAVVAAAEARGLEVAPVEAFAEQPGAGVEGRVGGRRVWVGRPRHPLPEGLASLWDQAEAEGHTVLAVEVEGTPRGLLVLGDRVRPEAHQAVAALRSRGLTVWLVTGDGEGAARAVAEALGIAAWRARVLPADKAAFVEGLRRAGHGVAFVGDGINDAPALLAADLGIALASGADLAREAGHLTLVRADLAAVPEALALARRVRSLVRQNLAWALAYNLTALPAAVAGYASPLVAAAAMVGSSAFVLGNTLRLLGWSPRRLLLGGLGVALAGAGLAWLAWAGW